MMSGFFMIRFSLYCTEVRLLGVRQPKPPWFRQRSELFVLSTAVYTPAQFTRLTIFAADPYFFFLPPFLPPAALSPRGLSSGRCPRQAAASPGGVDLSGTVEAGLALSPPAQPWLQPAAAALSSAAAFSLAAFSSGLHAASSSLPSSFCWAFGLLLHRLGLGAASSRLGERDVDFGRCP
jgi:hypothetical protein